MYRVDISRRTKRIYLTTKKSDNLEWTQNLLHTNEGAFLAWSKKERIKKQCKKIRYTSVSMLKII